MSLVTSRTTSFPNVAERGDVKALAVPTPTQRFEPVNSVQLCYPQGQSHGVIANGSLEHWGQPEHVQAWDWQFRGVEPPTTLLRQTWKRNAQDSSTKEQVS